MLRPRTKESLVVFVFTHAGSRLVMDFSQSAARASDQEMRTTAAPCGVVARRRKAPSGLPKDWFEKRRGDTEGCCSGNVDFVARALRKGGVARAARIFSGRSKRPVAAVMATVYLSSRGRRCGMGDRTRALLILASGEKHFFDGRTIAKSPSR
jgi:hypothetical protein